MGEKNPHVGMFAMVSAIIVFDNKNPVFTFQRPVRTHFSSTHSLRSSGGADPTFQTCCGQSDQGDQFGDEHGPQGELRGLLSGILQKELGQRLAEMGWDVSLQCKGPSAPPLGHGILAHEDPVGQPLLGPGNSSGPETRHFLFPLYRCKLGFVICR